MEGTMTNMYGLNKDAMVNDLSASRLKGLKKYYYENRCHYQ